MNNDIKKDWKKFKEESLLQEEDDTTSDSGLNESGDELDIPISKASALDHPTYLDLEERLTIAEQKAHENWEKATRAAADLENIRRRAERDIANAHRYSLERFIDSLLPVVDSLEQALQRVDIETNPSMYEGMMLTMKLFLDVLAKNQVEQLDPTGTLFDPQQHEAMAMQPAPDVVPNTILTVFQKGYKLNDRVIRPARVVVAQ